MPNASDPPRSTGRPLVRDGVVRSIRDRIGDGTLRPGSRLHVGNLSRTLWAAPSTVRAAMPVLATQGLVEMLPGRAPRVTAFDRPTITASIALGVLMRGVVGQTVPGLRGATAKQAVRTIARSLAFTARPDEDDPRAVAVEGYLEWAEFSANRVLGDVLAERATGLALTLVAGGPPTDRMTAIRAHHDLASALEREDPAGGRRAIEVLHGL